MRRSNRHHWRVTLCLVGGVVGTLLMALGGPAAFSQAEDTTPESTYHVEVLIFEGKGPKDEGIDGVMPPRSLTELTLKAEGDQVGRVLAARTGSALQLTGLRERLSNRGYVVLAHSGWTQTASQCRTRAGIPLSEVGIRVAGLEGAWVLERGTLLHFGMHLDYTDSRGQSYQLSELRRIRFNERNYYDNPGIGVIAVVSPGVRPK
jgi:hypothetical protein